MTPVYKLSDSRSLTGTATYYSSMLAGNAVYAPQSYYLLETNVLPGAATSVEFTNLNTYASDYKHLQIRIAAGAGGSGATNRLRITVNSSDANLRGHKVGGVGSGSMFSSTATPYGGSMVISDRVDVSGTSVFIIDIVDFGSTNKAKVFKTFEGCLDSSEPFVAMGSTLWNSTSALTNILFGVGNTAIDSTGFTSGSRFSLYGLKA